MKHPGGQRCGGHASPKPPPPPARTSLACRPMRSGLVLTQRSARELVMYQMYLYGLQGAAVPFATTLKATATTRYCCGVHVEYIRATEDNTRVHAVCARRATKQACMDGIGCRTRKYQVRVKMHLIKGTQTHQTRDCRVCSSYTHFFSNLHPRLWLIMHTLCSSISCSRNSEQRSTAIVLQRQQSAGAVHDKQAGVARTSSPASRVQQPSQSSHPLLLCRHTP